MLALKLLLVPCLIYAVTMAGRKWGASVAGWLSAFPVVAGPILLTITLEQGSNFGANAAAGTLLAVVACLFFNLAYVWGSGRFGILGSMSLAVVAYAAAVLALQSVHPSIGGSFAAVVFALLIAPRFFPHVPAQMAPSPASLGDLPWRMLAAAALVLSVTLAASRLGARLSGFLAMFPTMSMVLGGFSHHYAGRAFAVALLRGMVFGYFAFATFCFVVTILLRGESVAAAFSVAILGALIVQFAVRYILTSEHFRRYLPIRS